MLSALCIATRSAAIAAGAGFVISFIVPVIQFYMSHTTKSSTIEVFAMALSGVFWFFPVGLIAACIAAPAILLTGVLPCSLLRAMGVPLTAPAWIGGVIGCALGSAIWYVAIYGGAHPGNLILGQWTSIIAVGGFAGMMGGWTFAQAIRERPAIG